MGIGMSTKGKFINLIYLSKIIKHKHNKNWQRDYVERTEICYNHGDFWTCPKILVLDFYRFV